MIEYKVMEYVRINWIHIYIHIYIHMYIYIERESRMIVYDCRIRDRNSTRARFNVVLLYRSIRLNTSHYYMTQHVVKAYNLT